MVLIVLLLLWSFAEINTIYRLIKKKHLLFDERFIYTICMALTMISSFVIALFIRLLLPSDARVLYLLPIGFGVLIGLKFGEIIKAPAMLAGIYNGLIGGIMGMMLGAVLLDPALCKLPIDSASSLAINMYTLVIFAAIIHRFTIALIRYSLRG